MVELLISVADKLVSWTSAFRKSRREERDRIATYFDRISGCLGEIVRCIQEKDDREVIHPCYRLEEYSEKLCSIVGNVIEADELNALSRLLKEACRNPMLAHSMVILNESEDESKKAEALRQLSLASAKFAALADEIRAH